MKNIYGLFLIILTTFITPVADADEKKPINDVYAVIFIMDGIHYETFDRCLNNGKTPNIKKYFIDDGAYFTKALTVFPSASNVAYQSLISGLFPGHAGIPYLVWFDRSTEKPINYFTPKGRKHLDYDLINLKVLLDPNEMRLHPPSTIFDHLKGYETAAIYSSYSAGASYKRPKAPIPAFWAVFGSGREEMLDRLAFDEVEKLFNRPVENIPRFTFAGLYSFDALGHHFGAKSPMLEYNLERFDRWLGKFIELLKEKNIYDKTYIILASDHGMHDTPKSKFNLKRFVRNLGLTIYPGHVRKNDYNVYVADRGIASAHLYLKGQNGWKERPTLEMLRKYPLNDSISVLDSPASRARSNSNTIDIIEKLVNTPEIKLVIARDGFFKVHVFSKNGHSIITRSQTDLNRYGYQVVKNDPLEIDRSPAKHKIGKRFFDADRWGRLTADHKFPDAVVQLSQIFDDGRSGDIFIIAEDDWVFYRGKAGTHGSITKDDMHIPFLIRGPDIPTGKFGFIRVSDLYPTLLSWFGIKENPGHFDGKNIFKSQHPTSKSQHPNTRQIKKKLEIMLNNLYKQKREPEIYNFTPEMNLDANIWLIEEQIKRLN